MRFTLALLPNGKAILTSRESLLPEQMQHLQQVWNGWKSGNLDLLIVPECDVTLVEDVEIDLEDSDGREERRGSGS